MDQTVLGAVIAAGGSIISAYMRYIHKDIKKDLVSIRSDLLHIKRALGLKVDKEQVEALEHRMSLVETPK